MDGEIRDAHYFPRALREPEIQHLHQLYVANDLQALAIVFDGQSERLYVDGHLVGPELVP